MMSQSEALPHQSFVNINILYGMRMTFNNFWILLLIGTVVKLLVENCVSNSTCVKKDDYDK